MKPSLIYVVIAGVPALLDAGTVTTTANSGAGSLRAVVAAASPGESITFAGALDGATIALTSGPIELAGRELTIDASGLPSGVLISGNLASRVFTITSGSTVTLRNLHIRHGREAANKGGGLLVAESSLTMEDCSVSDCYASTDGGGLWLNEVSGAIRRCRIAGNESGNFGGGAFVIGSATPAFGSCAFAGNKSTTGGGLYVISSNPQLTNCTIQGNAGSGLASQTFAAPVLRNCLVWGNRGGGGTTTAAQQLRNIHVFNPIINTDPNPSVSHSLVEGANSSADFNDSNLTTWGSGNLNGTSADPMFINATPATSAPATTANLRLRSGSAASNSGNNPSATETSDLAGRPRVQDTTVDLGAYEGTYVTFALLHPALNPLADANGNGLNNLTEYAMGRDPQAPGLPAPAIGGAPGSWSLTFSQRNNAADVTIRWCTSTDCNSWTTMLTPADYSTAAATTTGTRTDHTLNLNGSDTRRFFRQVITTSN